MSDEIVQTLEDLERYGRRWERQKELNSRYIPPPPAKKMRVPGAAFASTSGRHKAVAAVEKSVESEGASPKPTKPKERKANKAAKGSVCTSSRSSDGESKVVTAKVVERRGASEETEEVKTYAASVQGGPRVNAPGNQSGSYGPGRGYRNEAWRGATVLAQARDDWRTGPPRGSYGRPAGSKQTPVARGDERPFLGVCNLCQAVGHRASICPDVICFWCRQKGHTMRNCSTRSQPPVATLESFQMCDAPNVTFKTCSRCAPLREKLGNGQVGRQTK